MVRHLDALQPIALTDNLWMLQQHPHPAAPRCLPCRTAVETASSSGRKEGPEAAAGDRKGRRRASASTTLTSSYHFLDGGEAERKEDHHESDQSEHWQQQRQHRRRQELAASVRVPAALAGYVPPAACPSCTPEVACAPVLRGADKAPPSGNHSMAEDQMAGTKVRARMRGGGGEG